MDREEPPALTIREDPELDRELHPAIHSLQPDNITPEPSSDCVHIAHRSPQPPGLDEYHLTVFPRDEVHRSPGAGAHDDAESPVPEAVPGKKFDPASPGGVTA